MELELRKTSSHVIIYSIGNILLKIVGLLLIPLYTKIFTTYELGIIGIIESTSLLLTTVLSLSLSNALLRWFADKNDLNREKSIVFTILSINFLCIVFFTLLIFPFTKQISKILFNTDLFQNLIFLLLFNVYIDIINRIPLALIRIREKSQLFTMATVVKALVTLGGTYFLIKNTQLGIISVLIGGITGNLAFLFCTSFLLLHNCKLHFLFSEARGMLSYSIPLVFVGLGTVLINVGDRYVLGFLKDLAEVGIYHIANKVASVLNIFIIQAVQLAVLPIALKALYTEKGKVFLSKIALYLTVVLCFFFLVISFFSLDVLRIFTNKDDFLQANSIIPILLLAYVFDGLKNIYSYHLLFAKKTLWIALLTIDSAMINILLNIFIIPHYGYHGAAQTTLMTSIITLIIFGIFAQKIIFIQYNYPKIILTIVMAISCFIIHRLFLPNLYSSIVLIIIFVIMLWLARVIHIKDFIKKGDFSANQK